MGGCFFVLLLLASPSGRGAPEGRRGRNDSNSIKTNEKRNVAALSVTAYAVPALPGGEPSGGVVSPVQQDRAFSGAHEFPFCPQRNSYCPQVFRRLKRKPGAPKYAFPFGAPARLREIFKNRWFLNYFLCFVSFLTERNDAAGGNERGIWRRRQ